MDSLPHTRQDLSHGLIGADASPRFSIAASGNAKRACKASGFYTGVVGPLYRTKANITGCAEASHIEPARADLALRVKKKHGNERHQDAVLVHFA